MGRKLRTEEHYSSSRTLSAENLRVVSDSPLLDLVIYDSGVQNFE